MNSLHAWRFYDGGLSLARLNVLNCEKEPADPQIEKLSGMNLGCHGNVRIWTYGVSRNDANTKLWEDCTGLVAVTFGWRCRLLDAEARRHEEARQQ
jgi:hypothetical protein